jgi:EKC/KEOPS complex subunit CGI121/TPRKB
MMDEIEPRVRIILFGNVENADAIVDMLSTLDIGNSSSGAIVDLAFVSSCTQLKLCCAKAMLNSLYGTMKTKSLFTEVIYNLSSSKNINETMRQFAISRSSSCIGVMEVVGEADPLASTLPPNPFAEVVSSIRGTRIDESAFDSPEYLTEEKVQRIIQKLQLTSLELSESTIQDAIYTRIAMKDLA